MSSVINYRTIADLNETIRGFLPELPWVPEVIAGIHKSGMLAASLFSAHLNVPVLLYRSLWETKWVYAGVRSSISPEEQEEYLAKRRRILVVEDAATTGITIRAEQEKMEPHLDVLPKHKLFYVTVYGAKEKLGGVHRVIEVVQRPRLFEWNWNNHGILKRSAVAMEGLLCHPPGCGLSTPEYVKYVSDARPFILPKKDIGLIVSGRHDRFRKETISWLKRYGIKFGRLVMPATEVGEPLNVGVFKHLQFTKFDKLAMFVEPDLDTGALIHAKTGRPVLVPSHGMLLQKEEK